jgi:hypothetical protein
VQLFVRAPPQLAARRNAARVGAERVPAEVWARLAAAFEAPDASVREFEQSTVVADVDDACEDAHAAAARVQDVWARVRAAWGGAASAPPSQADLDARRAGGTEGNVRSAVHAWDVSTRRALSDVLARGACAAARNHIACVLQLTSSARACVLRAAAPAGARAALAAQLNECRRQRLQDLQRSLLLQDGGSGSEDSCAAAMAALRQEFAAALAGWEQQCNSRDGS